MESVQQESPRQFRESGASPRVVTRAYAHLPFLADEVAEAFHFGRPSVVIDGTLGLGGHTERLLDRYPDMRVVGLDWDASAIDLARERLSRFGSRFVASECSYADLDSILLPEGMSPVDGVLLDLGLSTLQLDDTDRGFSFLRPGPLDMRMSRSLTQTAWQLINQSTDEELARLFRKYGEEPQARKIAVALKDEIQHGKLPNDAWHVAELIRKTSSSPHHRIDPATRCFQALRIAVNHELDNVEKFLRSLKTVLPVGGRAAVISFHSLEDRLVKNAFRQAAKGCICPPKFPQCMCGIAPWGKLVNRKIIIATDAETEKNPRSRSAKLRIMERI